MLQSHARACLDARRDADELLRNALGGKKLKELRRQRNRLAEQGAVRFDVARTPEAVTAAIETFLALEASGWKARRGTALKQNDGDAGFIRRATAGLAASGQCEIVTLSAGETPVAAAIVLRHQDRAFYFKLARRRRAALRKFSPRRAIDARTDPASVRQCRDRDRRFHRKCRSSDDQSDLAGTAEDRRCPDSAASARSRGGRDPCGADGAPAGS